MKAENKIPVGSIVGVQVRKDETARAPQADGSLDAIIKAIEFRVNYIGPVLEEILQSHHERRSAQTG